MYVILQKYCNITYVIIESSQKNYINDKQILSYDFLILGRTLVAKIDELRKEKRVIWKIHCVCKNEISRAMNFNLINMFLYLLKKSS